MITSLRAADLRKLLTEISPNSLPADVLQGLAREHGRDWGTAQVLLPHLLARESVSAIVAMVNAWNPPAPIWPASLVLETAECLERAGEVDSTLRLLALFSAIPEIAQAFSLQVDSLSVEHVHNWLEGAAQ